MCSERGRSRLRSTGAKNLLVAIGVHLDRAIVWSPKRSSADHALDDLTDRPVADGSGATVEEAQLVCVIEAVKMENGITAHKRRHDRRTSRPPSAWP